MYLVPDLWHHQDFLSFLLTTNLWNSSWVCSEWSLTNLLSWGIFSIDRYLVGTRTFLSYPDSCSNTNAIPEYCPGRGSLEVVRVSTFRNDWKQARARAWPADLVTMQTNAHSLLQRTLVFILSYPLPRGKSMVYPGPHTSQRMILANSLKLGQDGEGKISTSMTLNSFP